MTDGSRFYIDGQWVEPVRPGDEIVVVDPATEEEVGKVAAASVADVDAAVQAARRAFGAGRGPRVTSASTSSSPCVRSTNDVSRASPKP